MIWTQDADSDYKWHLKRGRFYAGYVSKSFDGVWTWVAYDRIGHCKTMQEAKKAVESYAKEVKQ